MSKFRSLVLGRSKKGFSALRNDLEQALLAYPNIVYFLFYIFGVYLVVPIVDVPSLGLSISAPIMFFIAAWCLIKPPKPWFLRYQKWIFLAVFFWLGIFISLAANGLISFGVTINRQGILLLVQYFYWLLVFIITGYFASQKRVLIKLSELLAWSVFFLALLRWTEAILYGRIGAWSGVTFTSQNAYGFQFSTFSPFLLIIFFQKRGWQRFIALIANLVVWGATAINGSRGSWIAIVIGVGLALVMFVLTNPRRFFGLAMILLITLGIAVASWSNLPRITNAVVVRFTTLQNLDEDKTALSRELLLQKGIRLFKHSPIIGIGAGRFSIETADVVLPDRLSYIDIDRFNRKSSHNSYIQVLSELGLVGTIPFALLIISLLLPMPLWTNKSIKNNDLIPLAIFMAFVQMSVHMWVIAALSTTGTWFVYGLVLATIMSSKKSYEQNFNLDLKKER